MKTLQQAAREYVKELAQFSAEDESTLRMAESIFLAGAAFATHWISVEDRNNLMPNNQPLFLKDENGRVWTESEFMQERPFVIITHWRLIEYKE